MKPHVKRYTSRPSCDDQLKIFPFFLFWFVSISELCMWPDQAQRFPEIHGNFLLELALQQTCTAQNRYLHASNTVSGVHSLGYGEFFFFFAPLACSGRKLYQQALSTRSVSSDQRLLSLIKLHLFILI